MSNPSCRPPLCSFNCCDQSGSCPASKDQCQNSPLRNPLWIYIVIGVIIASILILAVAVLAIFRKRQQCIQQKRRALKQQSQQEANQTVEIQMQRGEEKEEVTVTPPKSKKNIYVYDREVIEEQPSKKTRSGTNSSQSCKKSSISQRPPQNPFQRKKKLRELLL